MTNKNTSNEMLSKKDATQAIQTIHDDYTLEYCRFSALSQEELDRLRISDASRIAIMQRWTARIETVRTVAVALDITLQGYRGEHRDEDGDEG